MVYLILSVYESTFSISCRHVEKPECIVENGKIIMLISSVCTNPKTAFWLVHRYVSNGADILDFFFQHVQQKIKYLLQKTNKKIYATLLHCSKSAVMLQMQIFASSSSVIKASTWSLLKFNCISFFCS